MRILYPERIGFWSVGFGGGMETGEPEKKPEARRERPTYDTGPVSNAPEPHW